MKTSTVNGVTYELEEGWEPIETRPMDVNVNIMFPDGKHMSRTYRLSDHPYSAIAWQPIVAPKVAPWKPKDGEVYWSVVYSTHKISMETWSCSCDDGARYAVGNCYPTREAAEAARERIIAAHNGGAKWKGGV